MKIQFKRIITKEPNIKVFDGDKEIIINEKDFNKVKTSEGAIPLSKWCSDLNDLKVQGYPESQGIHKVKFDEYQQKTVTSSKYIGLQPMPIEELDVHKFDENKIYKLHLNDLSDAGLTESNEAKTLTRILQDNKNIIELDLESVLTAIPDNAFINANFTDISLPETINSFGTGSFSGCKKLKNISIPNNVTYIKAETFKDCISIEKLELPKNLVAIEDNAFNNCKNLTIADIPSTVIKLGVGSFENCGLLQRATIPENITSISDRLFFNCRNIFSINIPTKVTSIGTSSFEGCVNLTGLEIPLSVETINDNAFKNTNIRHIKYHKKISDWYNMIPNNDRVGLDGSKLVVECIDGIINPDITELSPRSFSELQSYVFKENVNYKVHLNTENFTHVGPDNKELPDLIKSKANIKQVVIDKDITSIPDNALYGCSNLNNIEISNSVTSIGNSSFGECNGITTLNIPTSVTSIGNNTFERCLLLDNMKLESTVTSMGDSVFIGCNALKTITLSEGLSSLGNQTFKDCSLLDNVDIPGNIITLGNNIFENCTSLKKITLKSGVQNIGNEAFLNCTAISNINLVEGITTIGSGVFKNCNNLTQISIPNTVETMGANSFTNCSNLTSATIGNRLTTIDNSTFENCTLLNSVTVGSSVANMNTKAFYGCSALVNINFPDSVSVIGESTFSGCTSLVNVDFGLGLTDIGANSFENCGKLNTTLKIPEAVANIGDNAFVGTEIKTIETPKTIAQWFELVPHEERIGLSGITVKGKDGSVSPELTEIFAKPYEELKNYVFLDDVNYRLHISAENLTHPEVSDIIRNNKSIKEIFVDNSMEAINLAPAVFKDCNNLEYLKLGNSVTTISDDAFLGCTGLLKLEVDTGNNNYTSTDNIIYDKEKTKLVSCCIGNSGEIDVPETVVSIEKNAFNGCDKLNMINTPNKLSNIGENALDGCTNISSIVLPNTISTIGNNAFINTSIKTVNFEKSVSEWYNLISDMSVIGLNPIDTKIICTDGNVTFDITEIYARPFSELKEYVFIDTITYKVHINNENMGFAGFSDSELPGLIKSRQSIKEVVIDTDVVEIKNSAFASCRNLERAYIPVETTSILRNVFIECFSMKEVIYGGTMDQWIAMVPKNIDLELPTTAVVICSDGEVGNDGKSIYTVPEMPLNELQNYNFEDTKNYNIQLNNELLNGTTVAPMARTLALAPEDTTSVNPDLVNFVNSKTNIKKITVLEDVESLDNEALSGFVNVETIKFNKTLSSVGNGLLSGNTALKEINIKALLSVTDASNMFNGCSNLTNIDISLFKNVNNANNMFNGCSKLTTIDTSGFKNVNNTDNMFNGCSSLTNITWGEGLVPNTFEGMFTGCSQSIAIESKGWFSKKFITENAASMGLTYTIDSNVYEKPEINNTTINYTKYNLYDYDKVGTYNLTVDCGEVNPTEFVGNATSPYEVSPFGRKLSSAIEGVSFNLTPSNIGADVASTEGMFYGCENLTSIDLSAFNKTTKTSNMFSYCNNLTELKGTKELKSVTDADYMFQYCEKLTNIDTRGFTNVSKANNMFSYCNGLTSIDVSGLTSVTDASYMFYSCKGLTEVIGENVFNNVLNSSNMFEGCDKLTNVDTRTFTATKDTSYMFSGCSSLTNIDTSAFNNVEYSGYMFRDCSNLTNINTEAFTAVTDANNMFTRCNNLTSIDTSAFANVENAGYMFQGCNKLNEITGTNQLAKVINASYMFAECNSLTNIDTSAFTKVTDSSYMFSGCNTLTELNIDAFAATKNTRRMFSDCSNLTSINTDNLGEITDASYMFNNCSSLIDMTWGDNFRPTAFESMFKGATANKEILASTESIEFIKANELAMELVNYKTTDKKEIIIINTIYTGLSEMYNPVISVPSFTFNGVTCNNVDFVFMGIAESEGNLGKAIYMSTDCLPEVHVSMDSLLAGGDSLGTGTIGTEAANSLESAISTITQKSLQPYVRTYDGHTSSEKIFLPLECEVQGASTNSNDADLVNKYPQWASFKSSSDSKIKYIAYSSNKYAISNWLNANNSKEAGNVCGVGATGESINIVSSSAETGIAIAFCL